MPPSNVVIIEPGSTQRLIDIGRLRYEVYVAEMGKGYADADHASRVLLDELDEASTHFVVEGPCGRIVAALRYTPLLASTRDRLIVEGLGDLADDRMLLECSSLSSRLVLDRSVRGLLRQLPEMIEAIYSYGTSSGSLLNFLHCHVKLEPFFRKVGFYPIASEFLYTATQRPHVRLCLQTDALSALEAVGSTLAPLCRSIFDASRPPVSSAHLVRARDLLSGQSRSEETAA